MKKQILKTTGLLAIIAGSFLAIIQPFSPTGAVIDLSTTTARFSSFFAILLIIIGMTLLLIRNK